MPGLDATAALWSALTSRTPIIVVYYAHYGRREELAGEIESLTPDTCIRLQTIDEVFTAPDRVCLLLTDDEPGAVRILDQERERLVNRTTPIVLFLLKGGQAMRDLPNLPNLDTWIRGNDIDPDELAEIDEESERKQFFDQTGKSPEAWLKEYRAGEHDHEYDTLGRALLLEQV